MTNLARSLAAGLAVLAAACASTPAALDSAAIDADVAVLNGAPASPEAFTARCDSLLGHARALRTALETRQGPATIGVDFVQYDRLYNVIGSGINDAALVQETHPDPATRAAGEACTTRVQAFYSESTLSRPLYDRLAGIDLSGADAIDRHAVTRALTGFRLAGVDKDDATRARITALNAEITETGLAFARTLREDQSAVYLTGADALAGLPADYVAAHPAGEDGRIRISGQYPDVFPILTYARTEATRRAVYEMFSNRAYPGNAPILSALLEKRYELAQLLGFSNYAEVAMADKMIGTPANAQSFIEQLAAYARPSAQRDNDRLLARLRQDNRRANAVQAWDRGYVQELVRREQYNLNSQEVRAYFAYDNVRDGIMTLVSDLFAVEFRPWADAPIWHESVEAYEVFENGQLLGRIFLDMHPRDGKYSHAANFPIRAGGPGAIPVGALICNFPAGDHETGLMTHGEVVTFLHEFGHLMHGMFSGHQRYAQINYGGLEWDFIESPSTLLEEWVWDYDTLSRFAVNAEGETIPRALVERMNNARYFGQALGAMRQLGLASVSLNYYDRDPAGMDLDARYRESYAAYDLSPYPEGIHPYANFGHLDGYSAIYYTYLWSGAISADLLTRFETNGLRDAATAHRYRDEILRQGGARPAAESIEAFLGRPYNLEAVRARLAK
ncbi:MAG TPA: M3 family metallopeptidase [Terricaulis sp.]|nr:M3 family metallopeptidase [Terricaulis sp.]